MAVGVWTLMAVQGKEQDRFKSCFQERRSVKGASCDGIGNQETIGDNAMMGVTKSDVVLKKHTETVQIFRSNTTWVSEVPLIFAIT
jgi:hypothetical protein